MNKLILVGCGKDKLPHEARAADLYIGQLFKARRIYAEASRYPWAIISAKHGLVGPSKMLQPYDCHLSKQAAARWALSVGLYVEKLISPRETEVELHAGATYAKPLRSILALLSFQVTWPLEGLGIGQQLSWYQTNTRSSTPTSPENTLQRRIAPGIWEDANNRIHWSITELLELADLNDTPENRERISEMLRSTLLKHDPTMTIVYRETPV